MAFEKMTPDATMHESTSIDDSEVHETAQNTDFPDSHSETQASPTLTKAGQNFCFVCGEPKSKIAQH